LKGFTFWIIILSWIIMYSYCNNWKTFIRVGKPLHVSNPRILYFRAKLQIFQIHGSPNFSRKYHQCYLLLHLNMTDRTKRVLMACLHWKPTARFSRRISGSMKPCNESRDVIVDNDHIREDLFFVNNRQCNAAKKITF
jgi:hypothetical protein